MKRILLMVAAAGALSTANASPVVPAELEDPVVEQIRAEGTENSQVERLAQALIDSIGPRLVGSPQQQAAHDWAIAQYAAWGIDARNDQYGTWRGWERGHTHLDLVSPRVRTLDAMMLAWSPGTDGPVEGPVVAMPAVTSPAEFEAWLPRARGKFVLLAFPQPTCRPIDVWRELATTEVYERMRSDRAHAAAEWRARLDATGIPERDLPRVLEQAGALGVLTSNWTGGWGTSRIFGAATERVPALNVGCEDYGLLARLAEREQSPVIRVDAGARFLGDVPTFNTIAVIPGTEKPDEYVVLSAHFDSWDGASGATDNGTGTVVMMEAMRLLKQAYPNPKRTILVGHWGGEEQGLNGSRAFAEDNPHVVEGLQVLLNQDNGTGRIANISMMGFANIGPIFERWLETVPAELAGHIRLDVPGVPDSGRSDHASFLCEGVPALRLGSEEWDYRDYTWHTNRDTFDKVAIDNVRDNAVLTAMLAYLASEEPERLPRERVELVHASTGQPAAWPPCRTATRDQV